MVSQVVNVGKLFRESVRPLRVQPDAVQEYISRIVDHIGDNGPGIARFTEGRGRMTITEGDVIKFFSLMESRIV